LSESVYELPKKRITSGSIQLRL